ncbi:uncharacterized protein [Triticum aestivum]|uniref:uncharacterized protein n=1 Tax=Triticum aestivum TaxID=4565 RepID=UPI001D031D51|nr:uncharacterized protein LOC123170925 [Triticum aestivum]
MTRDARDGAPRPKRRAGGRDAAIPPEARRPSPEGSRREAELRDGLLRSKGSAEADTADWRSSRGRDHSPEAWRCRGRDRRPSPRCSRSPPRSERAPASPPPPPRRYDPPRRQAQFPPSGPNNNNNRNGQGAFAKKKKKRGAQPQPGGPASSVTNPTVVVAPPSTAAAVTCFNCGVAGHCQVDCPKPPACYLSKKTVHPAALCPVHQPRGTLGLFGYALDDLGFFQMDLPEARATPPMTALISVLDGRTASLAIIYEELCHLFNPDWDWEVTPISDREFTTISPDPVSLRYGTHRARLTLALNQLSVRISVPSVDPLAVATLSTVWVQIRGLPPPARDEGVLRGLSRLLGTYVAVDSASLPKGPAVRILIKSPDPSKLKTTIRMFFNDVGYDLRILVEGGTPTDPLSPDDGGGANPEPGPDRGADTQGSPRRPRNRSPHSEASDDDSTDPGDDLPPVGSFHPSSTHCSGLGSRDACPGDESEDIETIAAMLDEAATLPPGATLPPPFLPVLPSLSKDEGSGVSRGSMEVRPRPPHGLCLQCRSGRTPRRRPFWSPIPWLPLLPRPPGLQSPGAATARPLLRSRLPKTVPGSGRLRG